MTPMFTIIRTRKLADSRETSARHLRRAEDAEREAAAARGDAAEARRIAGDWREFAAKAEEGRVTAEAERDKAQRELADMLRGQAAAQAQPPAVSPDDA